MNVICYKRVSTDDQADRGFSLQHQEDMLVKWCELNKHIVVGIYTEDYSGKSFDRPEWNKLMTYIKKNKGQVDIILCNRWDRFSRNQYDALTVIKELHKLGVTVNTVEQPLDLTNPDNKVLLSLYLTIPEIENDKNSIRTTEGSRRARLEGCWTGTAPRGYINFRDGVKSTLRPSKDAELITESFERMSTGSYAADEVRRWLNGEGVKICKQTFLDIIRNPVYCGKIHVKEWKKEPPQIVIGLHPPLISDETFFRANEVLAGRKRNMRFHDDKSDLYPLKGFLKCPVHGTSLTAYGARGRNKVIHHYYLCCNCDKTQRHKIIDAHSSVELILSRIQVSARVLVAYKRILEKLFEKDDTNRKDEMSKIKKELERVEQRKENLQNRFMDNDISSQDYHEMKVKVEKEIMSIKCRMSDLAGINSPFESYISTAIPMLENLVQFYQKSDGKTKKKILGCIFSEKMILEKGRVATTHFTTPINVLFNASKVLEGSENKKEVENDLLSIMAPPSRLERETL